MSNLLFTLLLVVNYGCVERVNHSTDTANSTRTLNQPYGGEIPQNFLPETMAQVQGNISGIVKYPDAQNTELFNKHILLSSDQADLNVVIAPEWYCRKAGLKFDYQAPIEVVGSLVESPHSQYMIATEIIYDGQRIQLRDSNGIPLWEDKIAAGL